MSPKTIISWQLGYMCFIYNVALNGRLYNNSCQGTKNKIYINSILTEEKVDKFIPMEKNMCRYYIPSLLM